MNANQDHSWVTVTSLLNTTEADVWQLLTDPKMTEQYMYDCQLHAVWEVGGRAVWKAKDEEGNWIDNVKAQVLVYEPYKHLAFRVLHQATDQRPEVHSELHFLLKSKTEGVHLTIKQGDFAVLNLGVELFERCQQGWEFVMPKLIQACEYNFKPPA